MRRSIGFLICGGFALGLACSEPAPSPAPEAPAPAPAAEIAPPAAAPSEAVAPPATAPDALTPEEAAEARRAVEAALEDVRKQIEQKAAELGAEPVPQQP